MQLKNQILFAKIQKKARNNSEMIKTLKAIFNSNTIKLSEIISLNDK